MNYSSKCVVNEREVKFEQAKFKGMQLDLRLQTRYEKLVMANVNVTQNLSAGIKAISDGNTAFAHTQALWRFLSNERIDLPTLSEPILALAREEIPRACDDYILSIHDWSRINYRWHESKQDRVQMTHKNDVGYELQSTIFVSDRDGFPIAVPAQNLVTSTGVWQSQHTSAQKNAAHLDELTSRIGWLEQQKFGKDLVHIVDREADSVLHLRQWSEHNWLIRVKARSHIHVDGHSIRTDEASKRLDFIHERQVLYKGVSAEQWIAEADVVLKRHARPSGKDESGQPLKAVPGIALSVRLVVSRITDSTGKLLAEWFLLTNLPKTVAAERVALWYYYRWEIESFFKLLKQAGHQLESWGQESGIAIAKRLLIVSQACAFVWRLMRQKGTQAEKSRAFLARLSGRQMKRSRPVTPTAVMDGFFTLMTVLEALERHTVSELKQFAQALFPQKQWRDV